MAIKQVIVVRTDLDMGKGKIASQVGHACVLGAEHVRKSNPEWFSEWWVGQEKVVLKVANLKELEQVKQDAIELDVPWSEVTDAGHTQIAPGTTILEQPLAYQLVLHLKKVLIKSLEI